MMSTDVLLESQEPALAIEEEVIYLDSLKEVERISLNASVKMEYNAIVHCRRGRVQLEMNGKEQVHVQADQLLLLPARKLLQPMMVSTDVDAGILLISDRVLKRVLGSKIGIWNQAIYLNNTYVIEWKRWKDILQTSGSTFFKENELMLFNDIVIGYLRILLLMICEELLRQGKSGTTTGYSTNRDKMLFYQFLTLLSHEKQKRQQVSYYAEKLNITPKYLSTVCHKVSNKPPLQWITDSVMEDCYRLLRTTDLTVKEISSKQGFPNSSFFGQYFREQAGMTPIEYRTKHTI